MQHHLKDLLFKDGVYDPEETFEALCRAENGDMETVEGRAVVARAHVIAWRKSLEARNLTPASIRRKLSGLSSLYDYLCERNCVHGNPVDGVKRPAANGNEGSTPALGDAQARRLLDAPAPDTLKGVRDRATRATLLYHGIRREELCLLRGDMQSRQGVMHLRIKGKRDKVRYIPLHPMALRLIGEYLEIAKHGGGARRHRFGRRPFPSRQKQPHGHARSRRTPFQTRRTSPTCRNGSATPTSSP
jgi:site-specific recombinase XerD